MEATIQITYERDLNHTYLVYEGAIMEQGYEMQMLLNNPITGILPRRTRRVDGITRLCYEISSKQPISRIFEKKKMNYELLCQLFRCMRHTLRGLEEYLLPTELLMLQPEFIYMNPGRPEFYFCLLPGIEEKQNDLHKLMEFLLNSIDYSDERAVAAAYECYRESEEENYSFAKIFERVFVDEHREPLQKSAIKETTGGEGVKEKDNTSIERDIFADSFELPPQEVGENEEHEDEKNRKQPLGGNRMLYVAVGFVLIVALAAAIVCREMKIMIVGILVAAVAGIVHYRKQAEEREDMEFLYEAEYEEELKPELETACSYEMAEKPEAAADALQDADYGETVFFQGPQMEERRRLEPMESGMPQLAMQSFPYIIGKLVGAVDGVVEHATVSRIHCKIYAEEENYFITDLNSTNGTILNGEVLVPNNKNQLHLGDEIQIGHVTYVFQ